MRLRAADPFNLIWVMPAQGRRTQRAQPPLTPGVVFYCPNAGNCFCGAAPEDESPLRGKEGRRGTTIGDRGAIPQIPRASRMGHRSGAQGTADPRLQGLRRALGRPGDRTPRHARGNLPGSRPRTRPGVAGHPRRLRLGLPPPRPRRHHRQRLREADDGSPPAPARPSRFLSSHAAEHSPAPRLDDLRVHHHGRRDEYHQ